MTAFPLFRSERQVLLTHRNAIATDRTLVLIRHVVYGIDSSWKKWLTKEPYAADAWMRAWNEGSVSGMVSACETHIRSTKLVHSGGDPRRIGDYPGWRGFHGIWKEERRR
ncbi:MAG: hypothetical protein HYV02_01810 [Deltaproteobacteria bacterium]|nr:hypothetical protein [Deltaproteobacteria bacterium]